MCHQFNYSINFKIKIENTKILQEFKWRTFYGGYIQLYISQICFQKVVLDR